MRVYEKLKKEKTIFFEMLLHNATILIQDQVVCLSHVVACVVLGTSCGSCVLMPSFCLSIYMTT